MVKKVIASAISFFLLFSFNFVYADETRVNVNIPTTEKNWFDSYKSSYTPGNLPEQAPSAIGIKSFSSNSLYDYKQPLDLFKAQASSYYINSFEEFFKPASQRIMYNLIEDNSDKTRDNIRTGQTGVPAFDSYIPEEYMGLSEEELKWLITNNIISRDPANIKIDLGSISVGEMEPLFISGIDDRMMKSNFLMALHKATFGVIESRPIVFDVTAFRKAEKITWTKIRDEDGNLTGYKMNVGEFKDQEVDSKDKSIINSYSVLDRHEFKVRLENDTHYVVATYPEHDKLFVTSPNVMELYIKSFIDKGILNSKNLNPDYNSKNRIKNGSELKSVFSTYGNIDTSKSQYYPAYAQELGPYESSSGVSHIFFKPILTTSANNLWGNRYYIYGNTITRIGQEDFFYNEEMITMDALKFIEAILRIREGDMTDTEARIVSYKYGANFIESLSGSDKSTVMYLTAKGILNFENFEEYTFLYEPFQKEFAYTLLYRVANIAARKNFKEIQLTDSDNFWISKGFGSYDKIVKTPDKSAIQSYRDADGDLTVFPEITGGKRTSDKNMLTLFPSVENAKIIIGPEVGDEGLKSTYALNRMNTILAKSIQGDITEDMSEEYNELSSYLAENNTSTLSFEQSKSVSYLEDGTAVLHDEGLNINEMAGIDRYKDKDFLKTEDKENNFLSTISEVSPFEAKSEDTVSDKKNHIILVEKLVDDPYKYLYDKKVLVDGKIPSTKNERVSFSAGFSDGNIASLLCSPDIQKIVYDDQCDKYSVTFQVTAVDATSALQLVDSKLETTADSLMVSNKIGVVSKVLDDGKHILLVSKDSLSTIDPEILVTSDKVLVNKRTGTKAVILTEQNVALVGNEIIEAGEDSLMVVTSDNQVYYNIDIISSLLSNTFLSSISSKSYYACGDIQPEKYKDVYTARGDKISTAITGRYDYTAYADQGDADNIETVKVSKDFINISQLTIGSNTLTKEMVKRTDAGTDIKFRIIVEWELILPDSSIDIASSWTKENINPTLQDINNFYYTRPTDNMPELQDYWDNNIGISNAIANVLYGTNQNNYITCGYLVPNVTLLFYIDDSNTSGGVITEDSSINVLQNGVIIPIAGAWFQEVGKELPDSWVKKFVGAPEIYNKIISKNESSPDYWEKYNSSIKNTGEGYRIIANENSKYFSDKTLNYDWFPAWVHAAYNNPIGNSEYKSDIAANGKEWRVLSSSRSFSYLPRSERRSDGTIFGGKNVDDTTWMLLPSGALYKTMGKSIYKNSGDSIVVNTRTNTTDFETFEGKTIEYNGSKYYVTRFDNQYLEMVSLDTLEGHYKGNFFVSADKPIERVGHQTLKERFVGIEGSSTYQERQLSVDDYRDVTNKIPDTLYKADVPFLITDAAGGFIVRTFTTTLSNGKTVITTKDLSPSEYSAVTINYHPVIRLSVLGWDITGINNNTLVYRRTIPAILFNDLFPAGLSKTVIDTLIAKSIGAVPLEELPEGAVVLFGDVYLYKKGNSFVTSPIAITSTGSVPKISQGMTSEENLTKLLATVLNMPVDSNGRVETIVNYINKVSLAPRVNHNRFQYNNTLVAEKNNFYVPYIATGTSKSHVAASTDFINSISYLVSFDKGLVCMPINTENKMYTLLLTSVESGKNSTIDLPYFPESLNFYVKNSLQLEAFGSNFKPLPNQHELKQEFKSADKEQILKDIRSSVQTLLCFIGGYLSMICVIMWFSLKNVSLEILLRKIKHPVNGRKGFDFVQILTIGIMNIDHEISGQRLFLCIFAILILFSIIIIL